jgi:cytochrome P450
LAKNPEKQEKLRTEILSVVGPKGNNVTIESLNQLNYLKACIKESLRLRPAVMGNGRILGDDIVLSGYNVKKGVRVYNFNRHISFFRFLINSFDEI